MAVACLILGYSAPAVLGCSLRPLREAGCDVFVHVDCKADLDRYLSEVGEMKREAYFLEDRLDVFWGGYSMMVAEFRLIEIARANRRYDKYVLISDDTVPILPGKALGERLADADDMISFTHQDHNSPYWARYHKFFLYDHPATMVRGHNTRSVEIDEEFEKKIAEIAVWRRIGKRQLEVYHGSQFWVLTDPSVSRVMACVNSDIHLVKSFEYSALSDELMVQSILGNYLGRNSYSGPVFADFSCVPGPRVFTDVGQLPYDVGDHHLFMRKISPDARSLLAHLTSRLASGETIFGTAPDAQLFSGEIIDAEEKPLLVMRLRAPAQTDDPCWNALERAGPRLYRWTAQSQVQWSLPVPPACPPRVRFVITTTVNSTAEFYSGCTLRYGTQSKVLELRGNSLTADFEYDADQPFAVTLLTPEPISPREARGHPDDRKLGLAIAA